MYRVLLGNEAPPEDVTPPFIEDEMSGIGSVLQQSHERSMLFNVGSGLHECTGTVCL